MMSRLIDADALINVFQEEMKTLNTEYARIAFSLIISIIAKQATAYDIEKVVHSVRADCYTMGFDESQTEILVDDVRKGGV